MARLAVLDSGPLYASFDSSDPAHRDSLAVMADRRLTLVLPMLVIAEVGYFLSRRLGPVAELLFLENLETLRVEAVSSQDWPRIAELVRQYADFPLGTVDASVIALAERLNTPTVITLDRRHFRAVRPLHCDALELLP